MIDFTQLNESQALKVANKLIVNFAKADKLLAKLRQDLNSENPPLRFDPPLRLYVERFQWPWYRKLFTQLKGTW